MADEKDEKDEKLNLATSLQLINILDKKNIKLDLCEMNPNSNLHFLSTLSNIPHTTASNSQTFFSALLGKLLDKSVIPVAVKLFSDDNQVLKYETEIYIQILTNIIFRGYSPNFVNFVGYGCCSYSKILKYLDIGKSNAEYENIANMLEESQSEEEKIILNNKLDNSLKRFLKNNENKKLCMLLTEKVGSGIQFGFNEMFPATSLLNFYNYSIEYKKIKNINDVLFQLVYSLAVLGQFEINHNDLHANNVLVMSMNERVNIGYIVGNKKYQITTRYIPYIFDWDFAYMKNLGENPHLKQFRIYGIKNKFNPLFDLYTLLCTINNKLPKGHNLVYNETYQRIENENKKITIPVTVEQWLKIVENVPVTKYKKGKIDVYELSGLKLSSIIGNDIVENNLGKNITSVMFYLVDKDLDFVYMAEIVVLHVFHCRMTVISSDFPTPLEMLETDFKEYEVENFSNVHEGNVYIIPTLEEVEQIVNSVT